jgi:hypothetical protein
MFLRCSKLMSSFVHSSGIHRTWRRTAPSEVNCLEPLPEDHQPWVKICSHSGFKFLRTSLVILKLQDFQLHGVHHVTVLWNRWRKRKRSKWNLICFQGIWLFWSYVRSIGLWRCFHLKTETESSLRNVAFWIKDRTMDNVQNCDIMLIYHHHKPIDSINLLGS